MYIRPDSNIKIYSGVPLDNSYENTLWFDSISDQNSYFHGNYNILKHTLTSQSYQRVVKGTMRVQISAEDLYDCNYLAFQNEGFGYKWFYAFILSVEYINNETSEITFEIDIMQTYLFDVVLKECFIDREHSDTDEVGDNIVPENVELGEYMDVEEGDMEAHDYKILMLVGQEPTQTMFLPGAQAPITIVGNTIQCVKYEAYDISDSSSNGLPALQNKLTQYSTAGNPDGILGIYLVPAKLIINNSNPDTTVVSEEPIKFTKQFEKRNYGSFGTYTPRNKKLYTYPYNFLYVTNMTGNSAVYPYEYFSTSYCTFAWYGVPTANTELIMFPANYKGVQDINKDEGMSIKGFPQCAYNVDVFRAWLAQNSGTIGATILATAIAGASLLTGNIAGIGVAGEIGMSSVPSLATMGAIAGAGNLVAKVANHSIQPIQTKGTDTSTILSAIKMLDFIFFNKRIKSDFAKIIDDYFTIFGYATHRVKVPNRCVRQRWTYTKTVGCNAIGECPADDIKRIKQIYDKGITFWVNPSEVGNYSLSNNPL